MFKRFLSIALAVTSITLSFAACGSNNDVYTPEPSGDENNYECETSWDAVANIKAGWNLGNTLDSISHQPEGTPTDVYETAWGNPVTTKKMISALKDAGFNAVRVPVTWEDHIDRKGNIDKEWLDRVQEVVGYVMSLDMYCIVNIHHDAGADGWLHASEGNYSENGDVYARIWEQVADRFKDYDEKLMFESVNEMLDDNSNWGYPSEEAAKGMTLYTQRFVDTIRSGEGYNKTRNLVVMTYAGSASNAISDFVVPEDTVEDHLILEIHDYSPADFCWLESWMTPTDVWGSDEDKAEMDAFFVDTDKRVKELGLPLIIGEWGSQSKDNESERAEHAAYFAKKVHEYGYAAFWWDCGAFALLDRPNEKILRPEIVEAIINASEAGEDK